MSNIVEELSDTTSDVVEFKPTLLLDKQKNLVDNCIGTDPLPEVKSIGIETNQKCSVETQTQMLAVDKIAVDERKLCAFLRNVSARMERELLKGPTPMLKSYGNKQRTEINIQTYQKISINNNAIPSMENQQGLATWLSIHTNNAPILVISTMAPHDDWCEHVNQSLRIIIPRRIPNGNFVVFTEVKSVPVKACLRCLSTNPFNKSIFVGSTLDGGIYVWQHESGRANTNVNSNTGGTIEIQELANCIADHGYATAIDWLSEKRMLTCHSNGHIVQWHIGKEISKENDYELKPQNSMAGGVVPSSVSLPVNEITALVTLSLNDFVVGTKDGGVYHCWISSSNSLKKPTLEVTTLRRHLFMVSSLLKSNSRQQNVVISCDLSGQVYFHDIRNDDEESPSVILQIPLPFKNAIACSHDAEILYCPGVDGSLECFSWREGVHHTVKGALRGKGSIIKCSENGRWIITGLYADDFQIFYVENE